jgi:methylenetetrahydrofolate reductase (NADPH)
MDAEPMKLSMTLIEHLDKLPISAQFSPPMAPEGVEKLCGMRQQLHALAYSAGCSVQSGTLGTVRAIIAEGLARAAVLVHRRQPREHSQVASVRMAGIRRIVALRGDMP